MSLRLSIFVAIACASPVYGQDRFFVTVYASQDGRGSARKSHCFATFERWAAQAETGGQNKLIERFTISWMPQSERIHLLRRPEMGRNLTEGESLAWASRNRLGTAKWGPFEINSLGYDGAVRQFHRLSGRQIAYKALDRRFRPGVASNCIHAISDIVPGPLLNTGTRRGWDAGALIVSHFRPFFVTNATSRATDSVSALHNPKDAP